MPSRFKSSHAAILLLAALPAAAQVPRALTVDWIYGDEATAAARLPKFAWTSGGELLLLDETAPPPARTIERVLPKSGKRTAAVDAPAALASLKALAPKSPPEGLDWPEALDPAGTTAIYLFGDDLYSLDLAASRFERLTRTDADRDAAARLARRPKGRLRPRQRPLGARPRDEGRDAAHLRRKRHDPERHAVLGLLGGDLRPRRHRLLVVARLLRASPSCGPDESPVDVSIFTDFAPAVPRVIKQRYPRTGGANPAVRLGIAEVSGRGRPRGWTRRKSTTNTSSASTGSRTGAPSPCRRPNRAQTKLDVWRFDRETGKAALVLSESDPAFVYQKDIQFSDGGKTWIVTFESDGHTHLFRYGADGVRKNAIDAGSLRSSEARAPSTVGRESLRLRRRRRGPGLLHVDREIAPRTASLPDPPRRDRDGAHHSRGRLCIGSPSRPTAAGTSTPIRTATRFRRFPSTTSRARASRPCPRAGWTSSRRTPSRSGSSSRSPRPTGSPFRRACSEARVLDSSKKYPVLIHVYGGPGAPIVQNRWERDGLFDQLLVSQGYFVASFDPRSATGQSKALEDLVVRRMMSDVNSATSRRR